MKKQIKKLRIGKKTISNLNSLEMSHVFGGNLNYSWYGKSKNCTNNQQTCKAACV